MLISSQSFPIRRPGMPLPPGSYSTRSQLPYGKAQELVMRRALEADPDLAVLYSPEADRIYKVDLVVADRLLARCSLSWACSSPLRTILKRCRVPST